MRIMKFILCCFILAFSALTCNAQTVLLYSKKFKLEIPEPSDVCISSTKKSLYIVSDQGALYETDLKGKIIRSTTTRLSDCEGVAINGKSEIIVIEERNRAIKFFNTATFDQKSQIQIPYKGKSNSAFEAITSNENKWLLFTEKKPCLIFIYSKEFNFIEQKSMNMPADISAATWNNGRLWLLSDENAEIYLMKPSLTEIEKRFKINVKSAEGIAFLDDGTLLIVSDKHESLYYFNSPLLNVNGN